VRPQIVGCNAFVPLIVIRDSTEASTRFQRFERFLRPSLGGELDGMLQLGSRCRRIVVSSATAISAASSWRTGAPASMAWFLEAILEKYHAD
jgi:hypothetical protein